MCKACGKDSIGYRIFNDVVVTRKNGSKYTLRKVYWRCLSCLAECKIKSYPIRRRT